MYKNLKILKIKKQILLDYIRKNQNATYRQIRKDTKIKVERIFPGMMKEAWKAAGVPFSKHLRKRTRSQLIKEVIECIKRNPTMNTVIIKKELGIDIPKVFGKIENAYKIAGVTYKPNINVVGIALPEIQLRANNFEKEVADFLRSKGRLRRNVKIYRNKRADALFYYKGRRYVIEVKNYIKKKLTFSDIKQVIGYMKALNCYNGVLIHSYNTAVIDNLSFGDYKIKIVPYKRLIQKNFNFNDIFDKGKL